MGQERSLSVLTVLQGNRREFDFFNVFESNDLDANDLEIRMKNLKRF